MNNITNNATPALRYINRSFEASSKNPRMKLKKGPRAEARSRRENHFSRSLTHRVIPDFIKASPKFNRLPNLHPVTYEFVSRHSLRLRVSAQVLLFPTGEV